MAIWRRVVAALSALALLLLTSQAGRAECRMLENGTATATASHSSSGQHQPSNSAHPHSSHHAVPHSGHAPNDAHPCATLSSCAVTLSVVATNALLGVTEFGVQRAEMTPSILTSVAIAPELPPPRA